jgi:hypothetical protein
MCKKMDHHGIFHFKNPCLLGYENEKEKKKLLNLYRYMLFSFLMSIKFGQILRNFDRFL